MTIYAPDFFALLGTKGQNEKWFVRCFHHSKSKSLEWTKQQAKQQTKRDQSDDTSW
jgi:hypothetical protein